PGFAQLVRLPGEGPLDPSVGVDEPLGRSGGPAGLEDRRRRLAGEPSGEQVLDRSLPEVAGDVGEPPEVVEGADVGERVEVEVAGEFEPERRSGLLGEVPPE